QEISTAPSTTVGLLLRERCSRLPLTAPKPCCTASLAEPMGHILFHQWSGTVPAICTARLRWAVRPTPGWYSKWIPAVLRPCCTALLEARTESFPLEVSCGTRRVISTAPLRRAALPTTESCSK